MTRKILSIIGGYAIFVISSVLFFKLSGQDPHAVATPVFIFLTALYGSVFSFVAGGITQLIAKTKNLTINYVLSVIIAGFATFSLFKSGGSHWTQLLAIFIFAPVSILGGLFYMKRSNQ
jgi:hypothetical protein